MATAPAPQTAPSIVLPYAARIGWIPARCSLLDDCRPVSARVLLLAFVAVAASYALLWTRYLYPLADSALYLSLARSIADGQGFMFMDFPYKRITPLHPMMLAGIIKLGGGIGAIHAANIVLMLIAHVLCFLTMRGWFNDRLALISTLATAAQFWVYRNSMLVMTEPPFLVMVWAGLLPLTYVSAARGLRQWLLVGTGILFLSLAFESRVAGLFLVPGAVAGLFLSNLLAHWKSPRRLSAFLLGLAWTFLFGLVFLALLWQFNRSPYPEGIPPDTLTKYKGLGRGEIAEAGESLGERYKLKLFQGAKGSLLRKTVTIVVVGGRWINELFAAPASFLFTSPSRLLHVVGTVLALCALACVLAGWATLILRRFWFPAMVSLYAVPFWVLWATRVHPRYLIPVAPIMFVLASVGCVVLMQLLGGLVMRSGKAAGWPLAWVPGLLLALVVIANAPPYAAEVYFHKLAGRDFYDVLRQGAMGKMIDIGGYLKKQAVPDDVIYSNTGGLPMRLTFYMTGNRVDVPSREAADKPFRVINADDAAGLKRYLDAVGQAHGRYAIVFMSESTLPEWYLSLKSSSRAKPRSWWRLYEYDEDRGIFRNVDPPRDRAYLNDIPPSKLPLRSAAVR